MRLILACICLLFGGLAAAAQTNTNGGNATEIDGVIVTQLGGHTLYIPKGYVSSFMGYAGNVQIQALLPCLLPETPENTAEFRVLHEKNGFRRLLLATLSPLDEMPYQMGKAWLDIELKNSKEFNEYAQGVAPEQVQTDIGPTVIPSKRLVAYKDTLLGYDIFVLPGSDPLFIVDCKMHSDKNPLHFIPSPTCGVREKALSNLHLDYTYDRTMNVDPDVDMAITIDDRLQRLLTSFLAPPAKTDSPSDATGGTCK
jgi:hypothetical protein